jgi:hypothetical protein
MFLSSEEDLNKLRAPPILRENIEVCDEAGRLLGYFVPTEDKAMYAEVDARVSEAELDRREAEEEGRPLADILQDLKEMP